MKFTLMLLLCSMTQNDCLQPYTWPTQFDSIYDCMIAGYEESINKMEEIGLMPSHNGKPGGDVTGYKMNDYIIENGPFDKYYKEMPKEYLFPWESYEGYYNKNRLKIINKFRPRAIGLKPNI